MKLSFYYTSFLLPIIALTVKADNEDIWGNHGGSIDNNRARLDDDIVSAEVIRSLGLATKWIYETDTPPGVSPGSPRAGSVSATPAVSDGTVYFPSWDGYMHAVEKVRSTDIL